MGEIINDQDQQPIEQNERPAGAPEGAVGAEPSADDIKALYEATGVKAPIPTGKAKGRPSTSSVRAKKSDEDGAGNSDSKRQKAGNDDNKGQSKNALDADGDDDSGNKADASKSKNGKDAGKVQDESGEADKGVRDAESRGKGDSERGREEDSELGAERAGQEEHDEGAEAEASDDDEKDIKRPGKSNPAVERRMQQLTAEKREAEERAAELERRLQEKEQAVQQSKIAQEDPEYTIEDFAKVRDEDGNILDLDDNEAELAWRRWKDGYDARAEQRNAEQNRQQQQKQQAEQRAEQIMRSSVQAYDHLASMMDDFPELVSDSGQFDADFAAKAMPIVQKAIVYAPGTQPGNPEGNAAVIIGLRVDPREILEAMRGIRNEKRSLPLNGLDDNIESRSNVNVPHSRSSDPTVNAANDLYKQLNINKRL